MKNFGKKFRKKFGKRFLVVGGTLGLLSLLSCNGSPQNTTHLAVSNEDAQVSIQARLKKTEEVRMQLNSIRDALKPLEALLADATKALRSKVELEEKRADHLRNVIERLRTVLQEAAKGVIENQPDGSWIIERSISLPLGREDYACKTSDLKIIGTHSSERDDLMITLSDCASTEPLTLASASVSNERIDLTFYPETLQTLLQSDYKIHPCTVHLAKAETALQCEPTEIRTDEFTATLDRLEYSKTKQGIQAFVKLTIRDNEKGSGAELELEAHPNTTTRIDVRAKN